MAILTAGGPRSLVATALTLADHERAYVFLLHVLNHRPSTKIRSEYVRRQAEHFQIADVTELELPRIKLKRPSPDPAHTVSLPHTQVLVCAMARAVELGADRLIWPAQINGDFNSCARLTEQTVLVQHLAKIEHPFAPAVETPLLELTDKQLIELGNQLELPWDLAWSCQFQGEKPCRICPACRRRQAAFDAAGITDPAAETAGSAR